MVGKTIGDQLTLYYQQLSQPKRLPAAVELLYPFHEPSVIDSVSAFYGKFFNDKNRRTLLIGINPGRNGGGVTGIPFTDPKKLEEQCHIPNDFQKRGELSSDFIYQMISHLGGPEKFYSSFLITSVCPLGFTKEGKNLNYYDDKGLQESLEQYMLENLQWHVSNVGKPHVFSLGQGKNLAYLNYLNDKYHLFSTVEALPHPRWILQYRRKRVGEFLDLFREKLGPLQ